MKLNNANFNIEGIWLAICHFHEKIEDISRITKVFITHFRGLDLNPSQTPKMMKFHCFCSIISFDGLFIFEYGGDSRICHEELRSKIRHTNITFLQDLFHLYRGSNNLYFYFFAITTLHWFQVVLFNKKKK